MGGQETLGVRAWLGLGGGPVTRPWGEVGASGQVACEYTLTPLTYTQRSTLRDTHTEHNTHTHYTPTNKIQTHNTQALTPPPPTQPEHMDRLTHTG